MWPTQCTQHTCTHTCTCTHTHAYTHTHIHIHVTNTINVPNTHAHMHTHTRTHNCFQSTRTRQHLSKSINFSLCGEGCGEGGVGGEGGAWQKKQVHQNSQNVKFIWLPNKMCCCEKDKKPHAHKNHAAQCTITIMLQIAQNSWKHLIKLQHYEHKYFRH